MATQQRRERERAQRETLIVTAAREMAETDGWPAVTIRRLAERIEYSQPVLYSHFAGRGAIIDAVALQGIAELTEVFRAARAGAAPGGELAAVVQAYLDFSTAHPALFEAIFTLAEGLPFGADAPETLKAAFAELFAVFAPLAGDRDPDALTEVGWAAVHGLAALDRDGRLRPDLREQRMAVLLGLFAKD
ncbi:TetR/AcrR family transcriptional regulator [Glycomyces terrestris]|uniref:TetR/AcrR family transcriptional regulator n=1 Tax=Glycomyces terrestris TaxID=2493553 RepID=A0A426UTQ4_9ACTN|nr:TetR/AcrR family transcriptional regulator [Glycomyces terrestris]RRR96925.1 TetR/AcrR family transcriptional regulator [Glycomyces terrestris]